MILQAYYGHPADAPRTLYLATGAGRTNMIGAVDVSHLAR